MKTVAGLALVGVCLFAFPSMAVAGHCKKPQEGDPIRCLNDEVAYLTSLNQRTQRELSDLKQSLPSLVSSAMPLGTVLAWKSDSAEPPAGWEFLDLDGRWLVGTTDREKVGKMINEGALSLPFTTQPTASENKYAWGDTEDQTPHATGLDHTHSGSVSVSDRVSLGPPSLQVRFIIKVR
jgi:hypothetical protein